MAGITLAQAEEQLADSLKHLKAIRTSQEYKTDTTGLRRADLKAALEDVEKWDNKVKTLATGDGSGRMQVRRAVPNV